MEKEGIKEMAGFDYIRAAHTFKKAIEIYEKKKLNDLTILGPLLLKAGKAYSEFGLFYKALDYYE